MAATSVGNPTEGEAQRRQGGQQYFGHFTSGKWYCECNRMASCFTVNKPGPNRGRRFWKCPKPIGSSDRCAFTVYVEDELKAIEYLRKFGTISAPETPHQKGESSAKSPKTIETPFTRMEKAKRKRQSEENKDIEINKNMKRDSEPEIIELCQESSDDNAAGPSTKRPRFTSPPQTNKGKEKAPVHPLTPPKTEDKNYGDDFAAEIKQRRSMATSPTPASRVRTARAPPPDLSSTILTLLHSDGIGVKKITEMRIRHEIGLREDSFSAKEKRYEKTIADLLENVGRLHDKVEGLESMLEALTDGNAVDDAVDFSD